MADSPSFETMATKDSVVNPSEKTMQTESSDDQYIEDLLEDILAIKRPAWHTLMALSPDGRSISLSVHSVRNTSMWLDRGVRKLPDGVGPHLLGSSIQIVETQTGHAISPFPKGSNSWSGHWSPDGRYLAAYVQHEGPACLGLYDKATQEAILLRKAPTRTFMGLCPPQWTPDGKSVVVPLAPEKEWIAPDNARYAESKNRTKVRVRSYDPAEGDAKHGSWQERAESLELLVDFGVVDVEALEVRRFALSRPVMFWRLSPDGNSVAFAHILEHDDTKGVWLHKIEILYLNGGRIHESATATTRGFFIGLNWSPNGMHIAFQHLVNGRPRIGVVSADGTDTPKDISPENEPFVISGFEPPYWSADSQFVFGFSSGKLMRVSIDGNPRERRIYEGVKRILLPYMSATLGDAEGEAFLALVDDGPERKRGLARINLNSGEKIGSVEFDQEVSSTSWELSCETNTSQTVAYVLANSLEHLVDLWQIRIIESQVRRVHSLNPKMDKMPKPVARAIRYRALDCREYDAALYLPPDYQEGSPLPMVVCVYGGKMGNAVNMNGADDAGGLLFRGQVRLLTAKGYAVLNPDLPLGPADRMRALPGLVLSAINKVVEMGIADPDRLGLVGQSYGGYCVLSLLCQTQVFKAAVASASAVNLTSTYGGSKLEGFCERGIFGIGGTLWERPTGYIENSPLFYLDRVRTPLLLVCGTLDEEDEVSQSQQAFGSLKRLGQRVEMRVYEGEQHTPYSWSAASLRDLSRSMNEWFDTYLSPGKRATD